MGFTYWAQGLEPPLDTDDEQEAGRVSVLQSIAHDLSSLVAGGVEQAGARLGPLDILASLPAGQLQARSPALARLPPAGSRRNPLAYHTSRRCSHNERL